MAVNFRAMMGVQHFFHEGLYKTLKPSVGRLTRYDNASHIFKHFLNPEDGTGRLSRNIGRELPLHTA
jgi:fermentation-respiration switch protein FrsA (DUF1100 family)